RVRSAKSRFARHRSGSFRQNARGIEGADRGLAARPGAPLVAVERAEFLAALLKDANKPPQISSPSVVVVARSRVELAVEQPVARVPHAAEIELRLGDPERERL